MPVSVSGMQQKDYDTVQYIITLCMGILNTYRQIGDSAEFDHD